MRPILRTILTTALDLTAGALISCGAALIYTPAAFIVAGVALLAVSWRLTPGPESETPK